MKKVLLITLFLSVAVILSNGQEPGTVAQARQTNAVKELLVQRLDTFRAIEEIFRHRQRVGNVGFDEVHRVVMARLGAELDLADSKQARIAILEKKVEIVKELEKGVSKRVERGKAAELDVLRARARRLKAEIALGREKGSSRTRRL